jgi:cytochrome P450
MRCRTPVHGTIKRAEEARERAYSTPLEQFDVGHPDLFRDYTFWPYFERLRKEEPVHFCANGVFGSYWSVTKYKDIMDVETNHAVFSSASNLGGITIRDVPTEYRRESFLAMDQPRHGPQRKTVAPMFTPTHLDNLTVNIRQRSASCLDNLPTNETFDWVDKVSVELTTQMLAVLFDFPWEERRKLTYWSDVATTLPAPDQLVKTEDERHAIMLECANYFAKLWNDRINQPPKCDLLSMMAHSEATRNMDPRNFLGNLTLLITGGNDTTRNTLSGSVIALHENPEQYKKLRENPALLDSFVPEVIRWQTPLAHMRRTALADAEIGGKKIKKGDKIVMWYVSGN